MYNQGLQNKELQLFHKTIGLNLNLFLEDILTHTDLFKIEDKGDYYIIYPLFYCDRIETDGEDVLINGTYLIRVAKDYEQIFLFITDNQIAQSPFFTVTRIDGETNTRLLFVYDLITLQPLRNYNLIVRENSVDNTYNTDELGYVIISVQTGNFEVLF